MSKPIGRDSDKFMLRLPDGMRERIKIAADLNNRSMNAEIVDTLEEKYPPVSDDPKLAELHKLLTKYIANKNSLTSEEEKQLGSLIVELKIKKD